MSENNNCIINTRSNYRSLFNHFYDSDGNPPIAQLDAGLIHMAMDPTQGGWWRTDAQYYENTDIDISSGVSLNIVPVDPTRNSVIDSIDITFSVAGTVAQARFQCATPTGSTRTIQHLAWIKQTAIGDRFLLTRDTAQCVTGSATFFPDKIPMAYIPPGYSFTLFFTGGVATQTADVFCQYRRAPAGARVATL